MAIPHLSLLLRRELFCWGDRRLFLRARQTSWHGERLWPAQNTNFLLQYRTGGHGSLMCSGDNHQSRVLQAAVYAVCYSPEALPVCRCFMGVSMGGKKGCQGETIRLHKCLHTYSCFYDRCPQVNTCWMEGDKRPRKSGQERNRGESSAIYQDASFL